MKYEEVTNRIICSFYNVYNRLGFGFLEKLYENALLIEMRKEQLAVSTQVPIKVRYEGEIIGDYVADLVVDEKVIIEIKACQSLIPVHEAQLLNYLKATGIEVGLLLNFGPSPEVKRKIFNNATTSRGFKSA